ncbi:hypothetical protein L195_g026460 [Trifolium pratense]|uniref:Uncharacterized protein n=1 Tax=Trifolium pratense TaxID=57577 RepID=A0A2K3NJD3_TRIPR|nr:hypothetical protein L195_g026460 [Trifolium pratense]
MAMEISSHMEFPAIGDGQGVLQRLEFPVYIFGPEPSPQLNQVDLEFHWFRACNLIRLTFDFIGSEPVT